MPETPTSSAVDENDYYEERVVAVHDNRRTRTLLTTLLVLLFLALIGIGWFVVRLGQPPSAPQATDLPEGVDWVRSLYAWGTSADTLFRAPVDAAIGSDGTIWIVTNKQIIAGFDPDGRPSRLITQPVGKDEGQIISLEGLTVAENGDVYVCDFGRKVILVFSADGAFLREFPTTDLPSEVHVRGDVVAVSTIGGVEIYDLKGKLNNKWGQRGSGDLGIDGAHGVFIGPTGTIYLSDTNNARIRAYTPAGRLLWDRGGEGTQTIEGGAKSASTTETIGGVRQAVQLPAGMTMDDAGRLLVVDPFEFQILALDAKNGQILARYGEFGPRDGQFAYPTGIAYDPQRDVVVVADTANNRAQIIRIPGTGGTLVRRLASGFVDRTLWLCAVPLILLMLAAIVFLRGRRRGADSDELVAPGANIDSPVQAD